MVDTVRSLAALQSLLADNTSGDISPQDLRDMLVSTYGLIDEQILDASATHLEIDSIPAGRRGLRVVMGLRSDRSAGSDNLLIRVGNGAVDSGNNYAHWRIFNGSSSGNDGGTGQAQWAVADGAPAGTATAGFFAVWDLIIPDYDSTSRQRLMRASGFVIQSASTLRINLAFWGIWTNTTDAIDVVRALPGTGPNWVAGSFMQVFAL